MRARVGVHLRRSHGSSGSLSEDRSRCLESKNFRMRKLKLRALNELYDATQEVFEPEITPVLQGGCCIQGPPTDESDIAVGLNVGSSGIEKNLGWRFPSEKFHMKAKEAACNLCAIPCSSCTHFNKVKPVIGAKTGEFLDEACQGKTSSQCSYHDVGLLSPPKSSACNERQHTSSETSNLLSVCSSHDPFSENAESKATLRAFDVTDGIEMLQNLTTGQTVAYNLGISQSQVFHGHRIFPHQHNKQKDLECHGDNISCISGADGENAMIGDLNSDTQRKHVPCTSASFNSLFVESSGRAFSCCPVTQPAGSHCEVESLQPAAIFGNKSDPSVFSSLRDVYCGASSLMGEPSESSIEQVESSFAKVEASIVGANDHDVHKCSESVKPGVEVDGVDRMSETVKFSGQNEHLGKSSALDDMPNVHEPPLQSQLVDYGDRSKTMEVLEDEVQVCDICGDVGREVYLAICSKCNDGAEHTYCMHVMMKKVPDDDWTCEECMLEEKDSKQKLDRSEKVVEDSKGPSLIELSQSTRWGRASDSEHFMKLGIKNSSVDKHRKREVNLPLLSSAKRPADGSEAASVTKRRALEKTYDTLQASSPSRKAILSHISSSKNFGNISPKVHCRLQITPGCLSKSNSLNAQDSRPKVQSQMDGVQKQKFATDHDLTDMKKEGIARKMSKSLSFNARSGRQNNIDSKVKVLSSRFPHIEDMERLRCAKENNNLIPRNNSCKVDSHLANPAIGSSVSSAVRADKLIACHPGNTARELKADNKIACGPKGSPKSTSDLAYKGSKYFNEKAGSKLKRKSSFSLKVVDAPASTNRFESHHELKPSQVIPNAELHKSLSFKDKSDSLSVSSSNLKCRSPSKLPFYTNCISSDGINEEKKLGVSDVGRQAESFTTAAVTKPDTAMPYAEHPCVGGFLSLAAAVSVPEIDYIWQGGFEMQRSRRLPGFCDRIQAHLSTCASPKVLEVVNKFPCRVILEEVPRASTWPIQFSEKCATENNIALYFFAKDLDSYGRNYKCLLECMIKHDLAVKGNFNGIELLIFSSNLLPEKSQRWNNLYFLWGVFRARRTDYLEYTFFQNNISPLHLDGVLSDVIKPPPGQCNESLSASNMLEDAEAASNYASLQEFPSVFPGRRDLICEPKIAYSNWKNFDQQPDRIGPISSSHMTLKTEQLFSDMCHTSTSLKEREHLNKKEQAIKKPIPGASKESDTETVGVEERECKNTRQWFSEIPELDVVKGLNYSRDTCPFSMIGIENSKNVGSSSFFANPASFDGGLGIISSQLHPLSACDEDQMRSPVLDLELSLGSGRFSEKREGVPAIPKMNSLDPDKISNPHKNWEANDDDDLSVSISLSVALPSSGSFRSNAL